MPSVIIKDMEMPEKCDDCIIYHFAEYPYCAAADDFPLTEEECAVSCPNWCPLRPAPEWISVETPPEKEGTYLVHNGKGGVYTSHYYPQAGRFSGPGRIATHWRPLPEPPKEAP